MRAARTGSKERGWKRRIEKGEVVQGEMDREVVQLD
jgi:hypothetical protein